MTESEDSIESYWEVIRPHLIERARLQKLYQERGARKHEDCIDIFTQGYLKERNKNFYKVIEERIMNNNGYEKLNRVLSGYNFKKELG